jgi:hypothetical protein
MRAVIQSLCQPFTIPCTVWFCHPLRCCGDAAARHLPTAPHLSVDVDGPQRCEPLWNRPGCEPEPCEVRRFGVLRAETAFLEGGVLQLDRRDRDLGKLAADSRRRRAPRHCPRRPLSTLSTSSTTITHGHAQMTTASAASVRIRTIALRAATGAAMSACSTIAPDRDPERQTWCSRSCSSSATCIATEYGHLIDEPGHVDARRRAHVFLVHSSSPRALCVQRSGRRRSAPSSRLRPCSRTIVPEEKNVRSFRASTA